MIGTGLHIWQAITWIWDKKEDIAVFSTFTWLQVAPSLNYEVIHANLKPTLEPVFYVVSWIGGAIFLYFRAGKAKEERKGKALDNEAKKLTIEIRKREHEHKLEMDRIEKVTMAEDIKKAREGIDKINRESN